MISRSCPAKRSKGTWMAAQGERSPSLPDSRARPMAAGGLQRAVAADKLGSGRRSPSRSCRPAFENATRSANSRAVGVAREERGRYRGQHLVTT